MNKIELKNKITAIYADSVRERMLDALNASGGMSQEDIAGLMQPWELILTALAGETDPVVLKLEGRFADAVRILVDKYEEQDFETPEDELAEIKCSLRMKYLHADAFVRQSANSLLEFVARESVSE